MSCGMLHPEITMLGHYGFNGINGKFYRAVFAALPWFLMAEESVMFLLETETWLILPQVDLEPLQFFFLFLFPSDCQPVVAGLIISRLAPMFACPTSSHWCSVALGPLSSPHCLAPTLFARCQHLSPPGPIIYLWLCKLHGPCLWQNGWMQGLQGSSVNFCSIDQYWHLRFCLNFVLS